MGTSCLVQLAMWDKHWVSGIDWFLIRCKTTFYDVIHDQWHHNYPPLLNDFSIHQTQWQLKCIYKHPHVQIQTWQYWSDCDTFCTTLTHWGQEKMAAISETESSNAFSWTKIYECQITFHWSLFLRVKLTIVALVQIMAWCRPGNKPLSESMVA